LKRCVMLAFILTTALVASGVISTELPWILCIMNAPLSIPFCDALMKSDIAVRPVQLQMRIGFNAHPRVILSKTHVVYTNASLSKRLRKLSHSRASLSLRWAVSERCQILLGRGQHLPIHRPSFCQFPQFKPLQSQVVRTVVADGAVRTRASW
jgi:hypothetical protein